MSPKESSLFRVSQALGAESGKSLERVNLPLVCEICQKTSILPVLKRIRNKSGTFYYIEWRHRDNRKSNGYISHTKRWEP